MTKTIATLLLCSAASQLLLLEGCEKSYVGQEVRLVNPEPGQLIWVAKSEETLDSWLQEDCVWRIAHCPFLEEGAKVVVLEQKTGKARVKILEGVVYAADGMVINCIGEDRWAESRCLPH